MSKRTSVLLVFMPAVLFGSLLFLNQTMVASGGGLEAQAFSLPEAPALQSGLGINSSITDAIPIFVNVSLSGMIPVTPAGKIDFYKLVIPDPDVGRRYRVNLKESPTSGDYQLKLSLYDSEGDFIASSNTTGGDTYLDWTSIVITYYFSVEGVTVVRDAPYEITVIRFDEGSPTPTSTSTPTSTPTATPTPAWDACEINDSLTGSWSDSVAPGGPCPISVGATVNNLNFVPHDANAQLSPNPDYFLVSVKAGRNYRLETTVTAGVDTEVYLYLPGTTNDSQFIDYNDDAMGLGLGSRIEWTPQADGLYLIKILNREPLPHNKGEIYSLLVEDISPTPIPTDTPTPTPAPGTVAPTSTPVPPPVIPGRPDVFEPNYWFDRATLIGLDTKYTNLNFVPWTGTDPDTDFFKLWVVAGKLYTCETSDLGTATNTNIIFCSGPTWEQCFAGNDNVEPFDPVQPYRSRLAFFSSFDGYLYLVIGQVGTEQILPEEWQNLSYSLSCYIGQPGTATPTPTSEFVPPPPTSTPQPTSSPISVTSTPLPPPTPAPLVVRPMSTPPPPPMPTPVATVTPGLYVIEMSFYYDQNENSQADPGEGISSVLARAYDAISGDLLSIDYTDETGYLRFAVPAGGPVRVSVPFFGFSQIVTATAADIQIRVSPRP